MSVVYRLTLLGMVLLLAQSGGAEPAWAQAKNAKRVIDFTLTDSSGQVRRLKDHKNELVVLEWMAPDCPHSLRHHSSGSMARLARRYEKKGVVWYGLVSESKKSAREIEAFRARYEIPYPILNDVKGVLAERLEVKTTLHMFVLKNGRTLYDGAIDDDPKGNSDSTENFVSRALDEALQGDTVTVSYRKPYGSKIVKASHGKK